MSWYSFNSLGSNKNWPSLMVSWSNQQGTTRAGVSIGDSHFAPVLVGDMSIEHVPTSIKEVFFLLKPLLKSMRFTWFTFEFPSSWCKWFFFFDHCGLCPGPDWEGRKLGKAWDTSKDVKKPVFVSKHRSPTARIFPAWKIIYLTEKASGQKFAWK